MNPILKLSHKAIANLSLFIILIFSYSNIYGQWSSNSAINTPVCISPDDQNLPKIISDGVGGTFVTWYDKRSGDEDIYVQRLDGNGLPMWTTNGVLVCNAINTQAENEIISDGNGGAIIVWGDYRSGNADIYAQKVNAFGIPQWALNGVPICIATNSQIPDGIANDEYGGAIISWANYGDNTIYVQRIDSSGIPLWSNNGLPISNTTGIKLDNSIISDDDGGAIITWSDGTSGYNIYAQRVNSQGVILWNVNGVPICTSSGQQYNVAIVSDDSNGAIITWQDDRNLSGDFDIYAQRINYAGMNQWANNGVSICNSPNSQISPIIITDKAGGAIITWSGFGVGYDISAQRINSNGIVRWTINGVPVGFGFGDQNGEVLLSDNQSGAIICWQDNRNGNYDIYAQKFDSLGVAQWVTNGIPISLATSFQWNPVITFDAVDGAIIVWEDGRNGLKDIYAQKVNATGILPCTTAPSVTNISICSNNLPFIWNSLTLADSGTYFDTLINVTGCDSLAILNLTINTFDSTIITLSAVDSYLWNSNTYTTSGIYTHTYLNAFGCDSIVTLNLIIYNTTISMTLQNLIQISPSIFEYDVILQNTGNTALALKGYSCGINHASGMRNGGSLSHTFISRDAALSTIPNVVPGYTASTNHLRLFTSDASAGNEVYLAPGATIRLATMRASNSVPFPSDFLPNINLQTITAIGKTQCIANCIVTPPGSAFTINGIANIAAAGTIQGLTGIVNTPCLYLNASANLNVSALETTVATCNGSGSGSANITLSGTGTNSFPGTYAIDGGASMAYASNPFTISNLSAGTHTIQVTNQTACVATTSFTISSTFFTPSIQQNDTTICLGNSIQLHAISSSILPTNLQSGLVAWYPFNGNANDESGSGNHGIVRGASLTTDRYNNPNSAYLFTGNDNNTISYIVANHNNMPAGNSPRTISAWLTHNSFGVPGGSGNDGHPIVSYGTAATNSDNELMFYTTSGGVPYIRYAGFNHDLNIPFTYSLQTWYNMVVTFNGTIASIYVNNSFLGSGNYATWNTILDSIVIGTQATRTNFHNGKIDDIHVYNRVLSASEIQQLYDNDSTSYLWSTGDTTASINVSPTQTTTYYLTKTNGANVCIDSVTVTVNQPIINAGNSQTVCAGDSVILSASGASSYQWSNSVIDGQAFLPLSTNTYTVVGTNNLGCTASAQVVVTVNANAIPIITPTGSTTFCDGESVNLQANTGLGISYAWYKDDALIAGATSNVLTVNQSGIYKVQTTNANTCSAYSLPQIVTVSNCNVDLHLKLYYQGYYIGMNSMTPVLQNQGVLLDNTIVDTVSIELHHPLAPYGLAITKQAILHTDGSLTCNFPYFNGSYYLIDSYYIAIKHRNGLTTWSANPITISGITNYDFTTSSSQAYGDNMMEMEPGVWAFFAGELNYDDNIDLLDYPIIQVDINNFMSGYAATDLNGDGNVDLLDEPIISNNIFNFIYSNQPTWSGTLPTVTTNAVSAISGSGATSGGTILQDGGSPILARGICYSVNPNPTIADYHTNDGVGVGSFVSTLSNLNISALYYVRVYATNANGTVYGNEQSFISGSLVVGDSYGGGKVAYVLQPGDAGFVIGESHGLIAAPTDQGTATWGCHGSLIGGTSTVLGAGSNNTSAIVSACNTTGIAADICTNLILNGYSDWYLPSKDELNKLYINRAMIGGFINASYWSSSEVNNNEAWLQNWLAGAQSYVGKFNSAPTVRAIRSFSNVLNIGVVTTAVSSITSSTAMCGGSIVSPGASPIIARGICWSVNANPTISLSTKTIDGNGVGSFTSSLTSLNPGTTYYVRAYATNANGTVYGNEVLFTTAMPSVGDNYGGGIVAYILLPGDAGYVVGEVHGLIAAASDQNLAQWGCFGVSINGADSNSIGTGSQNTDDILNGCAEPLIAAIICRNLSLNGFSDWFLPSWDELSLLYANRLAIGSFVNSGYWSSTESSANAARFLDFVNGGIGFANKSNVYKVRAVRSF